MTISIMMIRGSYLFRDFGLSAFAKFRRILVASSSFQSWRILRKRKVALFRSWGWGSKKLCPSNVTRSNDVDVKVVSYMVFAFSIVSGRSWMIKESLGNSVARAALACPSEPPT
jgi:hypothetical protein